ncbi:peptidyl-prolyl cis-trans isomerase [Alkalicoccobacillus porphyridii]|uniref:Peptidyl-prolyl cis-trans isomerase n=1 Tax=Alkalicoccobacillus porphyridii TaxID=2597270 RepID=A0A553ZUX4_9BACI|nr:peptidyl-prolyl cis-trans isomerase [Alkalicoccobacillus porphyridii]TSB45290.1 peptidyl-prolyl cis-trans isomerase [Alkalicoccobacillus porphyridii]
MNEFVFFIEGDVNRSLTIDPTVWIFDERKIDLTTYFDELETMDDEMTKYQKSISAQWDKERLEGSAPPNPNQNGNIIRFNKQKLINGTFGMPLKSFLKNADPISDHATLMIETNHGQSYSCNLEEGYALIAGFSKDGQPLKETGPVHIYFGDGSNEQEPITHVTRLVIKAPKA